MSTCGAADDAKKIMQGSLRIAPQLCSNRDYMDGTLVYKYVNIHIFT